VQTASTTDRSVLDITRPRRRLLTYYLISSVMAGPLLPVVLMVKLARYRSLRYRFDGEGISMSWGVLFHREVHLTYDRIQDIHLASNIVERYLGLARIQIQTASGAAGAEMTLEGLADPDAVRDFVYGRMGQLHERTAGREPDGVSGGGQPASAETPASEALLVALSETVDALDRVAALLDGLRDRRDSSLQPPC
jgi:hypothetical protein